MNNFAYRVYYEFKDPTSSDPLRTLKSPYKISEALSNFTIELPHYLADEKATVSKASPAIETDSIIVYIKTSLDAAATDKAVEECLDGLDLFGKRLKEF